MDQDKTHCLLWAGLGSVFLGTILLTFFFPDLKIAGNSIFILLSLKNFFSVIEEPYQIFVSPWVLLPRPVPSCGQ